MNKILIIEDEPSISRLIEYDMKASGYEVTVVHDGQEGLNLAMNNDYDCLLIDWMLPHVSGIEIVKTLREHYHQEIMIMLTAKDEETDILNAFEAGIDDYIPKPFSPRQLQARVKANLKRYNPKEQAYFLLGSLFIDDNLKEVYLNKELISLTKKEYELLYYLVQNKNMVLSRDQIINEIWKYDYDGDTRIVDVHIFKLRNKLKSQDFEIKSSRGTGYVFKTNT